MDSPQYQRVKEIHKGSRCFKPYYKWIVLNTKFVDKNTKPYVMSFKPYYKWIVLNTKYNILS